MSEERQPPWNGQQVKALRQHLGLSQQDMARELGVRQQTVSEWETSAYLPRGASARLLSLVAEKAEFRYEPSPADPRRVPREGERPPPAGAPPWQR